MILQEVGLHKLHEESEILAKLDKQSAELLETARSRDVRQLMLVCNMVGGCVAFADFLRALGDVHARQARIYPRIRYGYLQISSYGDGITVGKPQVITPLPPQLIEIARASDMVVGYDDIIDTGGAEREFYRYPRQDCLVEETKHLSFIAPFLRVKNKRDRSEIEHVTKDRPVKSFIFLEPGFNVGYGMGKGDEYRQLRDLYVLTSKNGVAK